MAGSDRTLRLSERIYRVMLAAYPREFRDAYGSQMVQDFRELCREELRRGGKIRFVRLWVRTGVDLASTAITERRSGHTNGREIDVNQRVVAWVGFACILAPLYFVFASLLKYELGIGFLFDPLNKALMSDPQRLSTFNLVSPVVFIGGLILALVLNTYAVLRLDAGREEGAVVSAVRLEVRFSNIVVVIVSLLLLAALLGYFFVENLVYRP